MTTPAVDAARPSGLRLRVWGAAAAALLALLALVGSFGWWYLHREGERRAALELAGQKRFNEARPLLLGLYERDPEDLAVVRALALGSRDAGELAEAEKFLDRWCQLRPDAPEPFQERFEFRLKQQQLTQAVADAEAVLRFKPADYSLRKEVVRLLVLNGDFVQAEKQALRCYEGRRDDVDVWFLLAQIYRGRGRDDQAAALTDQVLSERPDFPDALKLRADLYLDAGKPDAAVGLLRKAAATPGSQGFRWLYDLSQALARAGRDAEAAEVLREAQWRRALAHWSLDEDRDKNPALQEGVVRAYLVAGKTDDAVRFLTDILKRNPDAGPGTRQLLADCYDKQGKHELAAEQRRLAGMKP
jgi:predicted Zn-dependent protease